VTDSAPLWAALGERMDNPVVLGFVLLVLACTFLSKRLAELKGALSWIGGAARWWIGRQERRVERDQALWRARHDADVERDTAELEQLRADVQWLRRELHVMRLREQLRDRQARKHTAWDNQWVPQAQVAGLPITDPPPLYPDLIPHYIPEETP
jgi:hypothetical protein